MKTLNKLALIGLLGSALPAGATGFEPAEIQSYGALIDAEISWSGRVDLEGLTTLSGVLLRRAGRVIEVEKMSLFENGEILLQDVVSRRIVGQGGDIRASSVRLSHLSALDPFLNRIGATAEELTGDFERMSYDYLPEDVLEELGKSSVFYQHECSDIPAQRPASYGYSASGVELRGDRSALPAALQIGERITIDAFEDRYIEERSAGEIADRCTVNNALRIEGASIIAVDGAHLDVELITLGETEVLSLFEMSDYSVGQEELFNRDVQDLEAEESGLLVELRNIGLFDDAGFSSASLEKAFAYGSWNGFYGTFQCSVLTGFANDGVALMESSEMVSDLSAGRFDWQVGLSGLHVDTKSFFPAYLLTALGLENTPSLSAKGASRISLEDGRFSGELALNSVELADLTLSLEGELPSSAETFPGFISEKLPVPSSLLSTKLSNLDVSWRDGGVGEIVSTVTGLSPAEHSNVATGLTLARLPDLPPFVEAKLNAGRKGLEEFISEGGRLTLAPDTAMTIATLGFQIMMAPEGLAGVPWAELEIASTPTLP